MLAKTWHDRSMRIHIQRKLVACPADGMAELERLDLAHLGPDTVAAVVPDAGCLWLTVVSETSGSLASVPILPGFERVTPLAN